VRVAGGGGAVGGPAGVADTGLAGQGIMHQQIGQIDQFANRTAAVQFAIMDGGDTGAVIAAIFQPFQGFDK